jgi:hypothetical protein
MSADALIVPGWIAKTKLFCNPDRGNPEKLAHREQ